MLAALARKLSFKRLTPLPLIIKRTGKPLVTALYAATTPDQHARGLMFRRLRKGEALLFLMPSKARISLHMLFVFCPIDVVICGEEKDGLLVLEKKTSFKPFTFYTSKRKARIFLELPENAARSLREGDLLIPKSI